MLTVPREIFMRTVGELRKKVNYQRLEILIKVPLFHGWQISRLSALYKHFVKLEFEYKQTVYSEGEHNDKIYVVMSGEVEVGRSHAAACQPAVDGASRELYAELQGPRAAAKKSISCVTKVRLLGLGTYFGNEEGWSEQAKQHTARVSSPSCLLLVINKEKIRQNTVYEEKLSKHLVLASDSKKGRLRLAENEQVRFLKRSTKNAHRKQLSEDKSSVLWKQLEKKDLLHSLSKPSLVDLYKEGKLDLFSDLKSISFKKASKAQTAELIDTDFHNALNKLVITDSERAWLEKKQMIRNGGFSGSNNTEMRKSRLVDASKKCLRVIQSRKLSEVHSSSFAHNDQLLLSNSNTNTRSWSKISRTLTKTRSEFAKTFSKIPLVGDSKNSRDSSGLQIVSGHKPQSLSDLARNTISRFRSSSEKSQVQATTQKAVHRKGTAKSVTPLINPQDLFPRIMNAIQQSKSQFNVPARHSREGSIFLVNQNPYFNIF